MFKIPTKKVKGIEKGAFVVLTPELRKQAIADVGDAWPFHDKTGARANYVSRHLCMGYVSDSDALRNKGFVFVIPVLFDNRDAYQRNVERYIWRNKKQFLYKREDLVVVLSDPKDTYNRFMEENHGRYKGLNHCLGAISKLYDMDRITLEAWESR